jgi:GxxExxY protein
MYQEALDILFEENDIVRVKEYYFSVTFHGRQIRHKHYVDFLVGNDVLIECKAIEQIGPEQRQQLWIKLLAICTRSNLFNKILNKNGLCVICAICERLSSPENYRRMPLE